MVRPGAYINFGAERALNTTLGTRGTVAMPLNLPWGDSEVITVTANDLMTGDIYSQIGYTAREAGASAVAAALQNSLNVKVVRTNATGAQKAETVLIPAGVISVSDLLLDTTTVVTTPEAAFTIEAQVVPQNAADVSITWASTGDITISENGYACDVTAGTTEGSATVTCTTTDGNITKTVNIIISASDSPASDQAPLPIPTIDPTPSEAVEASAVYAGTLGNSIRVTSVLLSGSDYDIITTVNSVEMDRQMIRTVGDFQSNGWIEITGPAETPWRAFASIALSGGIDGPDATDNTGFFAAIATELWSVAVIPSQEIQDARDMAAAIRNFRENEGKRVQGVVWNFDANYEGIISVDQSFRIGSDAMANEDFMAYVSGLTAGASVSTSNTYAVIPGATSIINARTNSDIIDALRKGKFILSMRSDGVVVVEQDINTLHNFSDSRPYAYSKNRVLRVLDDIGNQVKLTWETRYIGKVSNTEFGRNLFKADLISYMHELEGQSAITNFSPETDIKVSAGRDIDTVLCDLWVQVVDSMEKLYMTVTVRVNPTTIV
jgi:hypothetical protein